MTPSELVGGYARRVKLLMKLRGLSAAEIARRLGYPYTYSPPWLRGRAKPPVQIVAPVADMLGCAPGWLLFGDPVVPKPGLICSDGDLLAAFEEAA